MMRLFAPGSFVAPFWSGYLVATSCHTMPIAKQLRRLSAKRSLTAANQMVNLAALKTR
jgi:hypothetical protein